MSVTGTAGSITPSEIENIQSKFAGIGPSLRGEPWGDKIEVMKYVDVQKSDAVEAEYLTDKSDIYEEVRMFAAMGPKEVVLTHKDGILMWTDSDFFDRRFSLQNINGRSGPGLVDVFGQLSVPHC